MVVALRLVVPWALLVAFLVCGVRWRIFLLGIPFLMLMGPSVFFDTIRVFHTPGRFEGQVLVLLWLLVGADTAWILVLYRLGVAGVVVYVAMFIGFGARAFRLFTSGTGDREYLGLVLLAGMFASALLTGTSWGFMQPGMLPMGLWLFAFVAEEALRGDDGLPEPKGA